MMKRAYDRFGCPEEPESVQSKVSLIILGKDSTHLPVYIASRGSWVKAWTPL